MPPGPMVLRIACDEQYYNQDDFLHWYGRVRRFRIWKKLEIALDGNDIDNMFRIFVVIWLIF